MPDQQTEREKALEARIAELEAAQKRAAITTAQGGIFEGIWRAVNTIIPIWLAVIGLGVFFAHYGFEAYISAQVAEAETALKNAKKDVETAKADTANATDVDGIKLRLKQVQEELRLKQAEAAKARLSANTANSMVDNQNAKLAEVMAQLANARSQASLARAKADAESAKFGVATLEQRAVAAKVSLQKIEVYSTKADTALSNFSTTDTIGNDGGLERMNAAYIQGMCEDNDFAAEISCPSNFIRTQPQPSQETIASPPAALPQGLRTPKLFNCGKRSQTVEYVICDSTVLLDAMARLEDAYREARAVRGDELSQSERNWYYSFYRACNLTQKGRPAVSVSNTAQPCVLTQINERIDTLVSFAKN